MDGYSLNINGRSKEGLEGWLNNKLCYSGEGRKDQPKALGA